MCQRMPDVCRQTMNCLFFVILLHTFHSFHDVLYENKTGFFPALNRFLKLRHKVKDVLTWKSPNQKRSWALFLFHTKSLLSCTHTSCILDRSLTPNQPSLSSGSHSCVKYIPVHTAYRLVLYNTGLLSARCSCLCRRTKDETEQLLCNVAPLSLEAKVFTELFRGTAGTEPTRSTVSAAADSSLWTSFMFYCLVLLGVAGACPSSFGPAQLDLILAHLLR